MHVYASMAQSDAAEDKRVEWFDGKRGEFMFDGRGGYYRICGTLHRLQHCSSEDKKNGDPAHNGDPEGSANRTLVPTQDMERPLDLIQFNRHLAALPFCRGHFSELRDEIQENLVEHDLKKKIDTPSKKKLL